MKFTPKEQFIVASVRMITDERAKKLPRETRTAMLEYLRSKLGVTKEEWHECAIGIMPDLQPRGNAWHATPSHAMLCCAEGGGGADLGAQTLGLNAHPAWEAGRAA